ncbi:hypothetical protein B4Q13_17400 [Lacticaseibacillus rhamnosus]
MARYSLRPAPCSSAAAYVIMLLGFPRAAENGRKRQVSADFRPVEWARNYEAGGAAAISVLTDRKFFQGSDALGRIGKQITLVARVPRDADGAAVDTALEPRPGHLQAFCRIRMF